MTGLGDMTGSGGKLERPSAAREAAYRAYVAAFDAAGESAALDAFLRPGEEFAAFVRKLHDLADGEHLPEGWVPASTFWLVREGRILGHCNFRHRLTDALRDFGGHVGYGVRPSERGQGYATVMLRAMLEDGGRRGIEQLLLTCDPENVASRRVIEKCGGQFASESYSTQVERMVLRYWVPTGIGR